MILWDLVQRLRIRYGKHEPRSEKWDRRAQTGRGGITSRAVSSWSPVAAKPDGGGTAEGNHRLCPGSSGPFNREQDRLPCVHEWGWDRSDNAFLVEDGHERMCYYRQADCLSRGNNGALGWSCTPAKAYHNQRLFSTQSTEKRISKGSCQGNTPYEHPRIWWGAYRSCRRCGEQGCAV